MVAVEEIVGDVERKQSYHAGKEDEVDWFGEGEAWDEVFVGVFVLENELFIFSGHCLDLTAQLAVLDKIFLDLLLVDFFDHLNDIFFESQGANALCIVPHCIALLQGLGILQLAKLGDIGLMITERAEVLEECVCGLNLELE